jgi:lipoprotein NlpI
MFRFPWRRPASERERALRLLRRRLFSEAESAIDDLLAQAPAGDERAFLLNKRGVARIGLGRRDEARADFEEALVVAPRFAPALANLGNLALEAGDVEGAIARYEAAIAADDGYALAHANLAAAYKTAGRIDDAVRAQRSARRREGRQLLRPTRKP